MRASLNKGPLLTFWTWIVKWTVNVSMCILCDATYNIKDIFGVKVLKRVLVFAGQDRRGRPVIWCGKGAEEALTNTSTVNNNMADSLIIL